MSIIIGADMVPTKSNVEHFNNGDGIILVGNELYDFLQGADYRVFNLEVPLVDEPSPIKKQGPNLIAPTSAIKGFSALKVNLLTLANNHILDQGKTGLFSTIQTLEGVGIAYVGAGSTLYEAQKPYVFECASKRIGVYACAEHEFSIAEEDKPGANPFDPLWSLDHIEDLKKRVDYVITLYHGGKEHYRYPSPILQKTCRRIVDKGADLVICQHSHCIGCEEKYRNGTIVYGQGNFIFDDSDDECWQTSLLVEVKDDFSISYVPLVKNMHGVCIAEGNRAKEIMDDFSIRSEEILKPSFIKNTYINTANSSICYYLWALSGRRSFAFRVLNRLSGGRYLINYLNKTYGVPEQLRIANYLDCEAHRELVSQALANAYLE